MAAASAATDMIEVWVEIFTDDSTSSSSVTSAINSHFRLGRTSQDAYLAAELMRKAKESRKAVEDAVSASINKTLRPKQQDRALAKLQTIRSKKESISDSDIKLLVYLNEGGEHLALAQHVFPANKPSLVGEIADLTGLTYMEEPNVVRSLQERYTNHKCYTNIASILIAINPYRRLDIYNAAYMVKYRDRNDRSLGPHIFASAETAYSELNRPFSLRRQPNGPVNQSIIVCGESGSGKTESSKYLMRYLANRSHGQVLDDEDDEDDTKNHERLIERQILEANHILEAFGNANTLLNHNSSRFGKFTRLYFATENINAGHGEVVGGSTTTYLLEKSRLVRQNRGERNFHVFYQMLGGLNSTERKQYRLEGRTAQDFHYINQGECFNVDGIDDCKWFINLVKAMGVLGISESHRSEVFAILAGLLHLGNISFIENDKHFASIDPSCEVTIKDAAFLFGFGSSDDLEVLFRKRLTTVRIKTPGEWIEKNLSLEDASFNRDSIAKSLYSNLFRWIVDQLNMALSNTQDLPWIGILDVFGFESFQNNSFEQFCINFANEMLQQHFNQEILLSEQKEYAKESILWTPMHVPDNQNTIDLISDNRSGILALLDSACKMRGTTVEAFVDSVNKQHVSHDRFDKVTRGSKYKNIRHGFLIHHYAGKVVYNADEFLVKNNESEDPETLKLFSQSSTAIVTELFKTDEPDSEPSKNGPRRVASSFSSVSSTFKKQLVSLIQTLSSTNSYFVRCVKPNTEYKSWAFDQDYVRPQLRCGGLVEAVRMLKIGFPTRVAFDAVYAQYSPLLNPPPKTPLNKRDFSQAVLFLFGLRRNEYQLGLTKIFFRAGKRAFLETVMNRDEKLSNKDMAALLGFINRKRWQRGIATVKCTVLAWQTIRLLRLLDTWRMVSRQLVIYKHTFVKYLRRARRRLAIATLQNACCTYLRACEAMGSLRKAKLEAERLEKLRRQQEEQKRKEQEELELRARLEEQQAIARAAAAAAAPVPASAEAVVDSVPDSPDKQPTERRENTIFKKNKTLSKTTSAVVDSEPRVISSAADQARIKELEVEVTSLKQQLLSANSEIERLKDVVDQLDDINNRLVEDLMNELVLRTQFQEETGGLSSGMSPSPQPAATPRASNSNNNNFSLATDGSIIQDNVDLGFKASGGFAPSDGIRPRKSAAAAPIRRNSRRNQSDCTVQ